MHTFPNTTPVADRTRSPLYYVDARDLGSVADMDVNLRKVMADAAEWNALLLIDGKLCRDTIEALQVYSTPA